ncbi:hypothetical protein, partial [Roseovarius sp. SYSU LYC5161]|uniref:hypothetical protein n=1 Tax=Roseovarius halophilus (ex Wu et al. 2025) TaxID=3376060 RepID=UPI0039994CA9
VSLRSGYALPTKHHPSVLILIDARLSPCLSRGMRRFRFGLVAVGVIERPRILCDFLDLHISAPFWS